MQTFVKAEELERSRCAQFLEELAQQCKDPEKAEMLLQVAKAVRANNKHPHLTGF